MNLNKILQEHSVSLESVRKESEQMAKKEKQERAIRAVSEANALLSQTILSKVESIRKLQKQIRTHKKEIGVLSLESLGKMKTKQTQIYHQICHILRNGGVQL